MSDPTDAAKQLTATERAENAGAALDAYQNRVITDGTITHQQSKLLAASLIRGLINDLGHYADQAHLDFDTILDEVAQARSTEMATDLPTQDHPFRVGSEVELKPDTGTRASPARRGYVTAVEEPTDYGEAVYMVRFPGIPAGEFHLPASGLRPASTSFPTTTTRTSIIRSAAQAEQQLVKVAARVVSARRSNQTVDLADVTDRALLAETLGHWTGTSGERVLLSLGPKIERTVAQLSSPAAGSSTEPRPTKSSAPAQLAKADFPHDIKNGVPSPRAGNPPQPPPSASDGPRRKP